MRSTPEATERPLVLPPKPAPAQAPAVPTWSKTDTPGIERSSDGQLRTNTPPPPIFIIDDGQDADWAGIDFRPPYFIRWPA